jgi:hypothetical protein
MNPAPPHCEPPDPIFDSQEQLFYRVKPQDIQESVDGEFMVNAGAVRLCAMSCNREKYRPIPEAVYIRSSNGIVSFAWPDFNHIAAIQIGSVPNTVPLEQGIWGFKVVHCPEDENYSHSEIRVWPDEKPFKPDRKIRNHELRLLLQDEIASRMYIVRKPPVKNPS